MYFRKKTVWVLCAFTWLFLHFVVLVLKIMGSLLFFFFCVCERVEKGGDNPHPVDSSEPDKSK